MRQERTVQASVFDLFAGHEIGRELKGMSDWLDEQRHLTELVAADLRRHGVKETGREGLPAEAVLRCALLKQHRQLSYQELAFHLEDSASFRAFARLPWGWSPKKSVLHKTISAIRASTWEDINEVLLSSARHEKLESGRVIRVDSTVTAALIHEPSDSSLLWDAVRVMVRLLRQADKLGSGALSWHDHCRAAKKRARAIQYSRGRPKRVQLYRELLGITRTTLGYLRQAAERLTPAADLDVIVWQEQAAPLSTADRADHRPDRAAGAGRRGGAGRREAGQPVRTACRHHRQGRPRCPLWPQAQPDDGQERHGSRPHRRSRQSGRQRAVAADASSATSTDMASRHVRRPPMAAMPAAPI